MKLYQFAWGIYPRRIHIYLREKGITQLELEELDVLEGENRRPAYLAKNPLGTIPTLETDTGSFVRQSSTILLYLEQRFPTPSLIGASDSAKARTLDQLFLVNEAYHFAGMCTLYGSPVLAQRREPSDEVARAMRFEYEQALQGLELVSGEGDYLGGDEPSLADVVFFASQQFMQELYGLQLPQGLARLRMIYARFSERPSAALAPYPEPVARLAPLRDF